jgi:hypothetical protein
MTAPAHIFVFYAHSDGAELARRFVDDFQGAGFHAWLDKSRLVGGACWTAEIEKAIDESQVVIVLLTNVRTIRISAARSNSEPSANANT